MIPHKEDLIELEQLAKRQKRMYPYATDLGVPYAEIDLPRYRRAVKNLMDFYKYESRNIDSGKTVTMFIPFEHDEGRLVGIELSVSGWVDTQIAGGGFVSIEIRRT
jgi:hypothetical protein